MIKNIKIILKQIYLQRKNKSKENILKGGGGYLTHYPPVEINIFKKFNFIA